MISGAYINPNHRQSLQYYVGNNTIRLLSVYVHVHVFVLYEINEWFVFLEQNIYKLIFVNFSVYVWLRESSLYIILD